MTALVLRNDKDGCAVLTLNRPDKLNSLNVALFAELDAHVDAIANETDRIGLVIVRGAGKCFSAGHDLNDISAGEKPPRPHFQAGVIEKLANLPQPVITAVHGHCYTGALELALAGDLLVCSENAKFADTHARWALTPVWGMSQRLPRRVGKAKAMEMMFTSRNYSGREAAEMGLANFCVADAELDAAVAQFAKEVLANSWRSNAANKKLLKDTDGLTEKAGLAHELHRTVGRGNEMGERLARMRK